MEQAPSLHPNTDFLFGITGHNRNYRAYPESQLEEQIRLAAELGSRIYRFNYGPTTADELVYLDKVVSLTGAYGMDLMLVTGYYELEPEALETQMRMLAARYDGTKGHGRIAYFQIFNEKDNTAINSAAVDGSQPAHYKPETLLPMPDKFQAAIRGVRAGNPDAKTVINFSYLHTGFLEYLIDHGVEWDVIGLDWYSNMGDIDRILPTLLGRFPYDILICETNVWPRADGDYDTNVTYLTDLIKRVPHYDHPQAGRIKGLIIYELLDEMNFEPEGTFECEAHFGLVYCDKEGCIGEKKPAYHAVQRLLSGKAVSPR